MSAKTKIPQGQYRRIENGKVEPAVSTLKKLPKVFDVSVSEFFRSDNLEDELNLPVLEKIKMIDALCKNEQQAIFTMINMAILNKKLKDNLQSLIAQQKTAKLLSVRLCYYNVERIYQTLTLLPVRIPRKS